MNIERISAPTLFVRSLEQTAAFYGLKLGFAVMLPERVSGASLIVICRGGEQLHFRVGGESVSEVRPPGSPRCHAFIHVPDADALAAARMEELATSARPSTKGMSWIVQGWLWVEAASGALGAVA
jgi:hypothetical protein